MTVAEEVSIPALASPTIPARPGLTKVHPGLTVMTSESLLAAALITVDSIYTGSPIEAGARSAVVVIGLTEPATEAASTSAGEGVDVVLACGSVLTRVLCTLVHVFLAVLASKAGDTETLIVCRLVQASSPV